MKNINSQFIEGLIHEMQYRNYSPRSVLSYSGLLSKIANFCDQPLDKITTQEFKDYLHHRITVDEISITMVNQYISAFKILQVDVLHREWEQLKIKRPRREKNVPYPEYITSNRPLYHSQMSHQVRAVNLT